MILSNDEEVIYKATRKKEYSFSTGSSNRIRDIVLIMAHAPITKKEEKKEDKNVSK